MKKKLKEVVIILNERLSSWHSHWSTVSSHTPPPHTHTLAAAATTTRHTLSNILQTLMDTKRAAGKVWNRRAWRFDFKPTHCQHQTDAEPQNRSPVASVCSLAPSLLVTLHVTNVFLASFLSKLDSRTTVLPKGMGLFTEEGLLEQSQQRGNCNIVWKFPFYITWTLLMAPTKHATSIHE